MKLLGRSLLAVASTAIVPGLLTNCGGGGGGGHSEGTIGAAALHGQITFGPVHDANVEVFEVSSTGLNGTRLGASRSGADGSFTVQLQTVPVGPTRVVASGGAYTSEFDGSNVDLRTFSFSCLLDELPAAADKVSLTPITDMVNALTVGQLDGTQTIQEAHAAARTLLGAFFGINGDVETLVPSFGVADLGTELFKYGLVLGALDTLGMKLAPSARGEVSEALSRDASDGRLDGQDHGVPVSLGSGTLPSTAGTSDLLCSLAVYANSGKQILDQRIDPSRLSVMTSDVRTGVVNSALTPPAIGIPAGTTGVVSTLAFDGRQWVYLAASRQGVVAIDVTDPDAANPETKHWWWLSTDVFEQRPIGGAIPLLGADHPQLLVYCYVRKKVALVNALSGVVEREVDLTIDSLQSPYIAGGVPDPGRDGVWLATAVGYQFWSRQTLTFEELYTIECPHEKSENFGGDVPHGLLWCPNLREYCGGGLTGGVQLVDFGKRNSYYMEESAFDHYFRSKGLDRSIGGCVDRKFQVGIISNDLTDDVGFVNLATISHEDVPPPALSTFTPAPVDGAVHLHLAPAGGRQFTGSAVDSSTHLVFFMSSWTRHIGVGLLEDPSAVPSGTWAGLVDWRYNTVTDFQYSYEPNLVGTINSLANSKTYAYVLDGGFRRALQVDLADFLALDPDAASDGYMVSADLQALGVIINRVW